MKNTIKLTVMLMFYCVVGLCQDKVDPINRIKAEDPNINSILDNGRHYMRGWNWGSRGKKLDEELSMNFYHGYNYF